MRLALAPWSAGGTHANFSGVPDRAAEAARAWTAQAYQRLLAIKQSYDPANLFGAGCAIQPRR